MTTELVAFVYQGTAVSRDGGDFVSLTDMWKASGSPAEKRPNDWSQTPGAKGFIENLASSLNTVESGIMKSSRGKGVGGTWGHWQVALAYAKYLSHDFHLFVNEAFREWTEEKADPSLKVGRGLAAMQGETMSVLDQLAVMTRIAREQQALKDEVSEVHYRQEASDLRVDRLEAKVEALPAAPAEKKPLYRGLNVRGTAPFFGHVGASAATTGLSKNVLFRQAYVEWCEKRGFGPVPDALKS